MSKEKIAILGGGVSAITAAFYLTSQPNWTEKYEITLYQLGWRIGGKGASGRNPDMGERIEEHGLHVWFGAYVNSFKTIQGIYNKLNRPAGTPLAKWDEAFRPHSYVVLEELIAGEWDTWGVDFPEIPGNPADGSLDFHFWEIVRLAYYWIKKFIDDVEDCLEEKEAHAELKVEDDDNDEGFFAHVYDEIKETIDDIKEDVEEIVDDVEDALSSMSRNIRVATKQIGHFLDKRAEDHDLVNTKHSSAFGYIIHKLKEWLEEEVEDLLEENDDLRRAYICVDLGLAMLAGLIDDKVYSEGFGVLNKYDFREWLEKNGANPDFSVDSAPVRGFYDLVFAYEDGDFSKPNVEAGVAALAMMRIMLCYTGGVMWKMQAGMGDVIFAPAYELLEQAGVKFEYFHKVEELIPQQAADGSYEIGAIDITQQVKLKNGEYNPLVPVKGLPCWPSIPNYQYIDDVQAQLLQQNNINLESNWSNWPEVYEEHYGEPLPKITLKKGVDFDKVVFGISIASLPHLCPQLLVLDDKLKICSEEVKAVATQAFQLWLDKPLADLGWDHTPESGEEPILSAFSEPYDTWASMDQLICREVWPPEHEPKNVAYFCGAFTISDYPPFDDHGFPAACNQTAKAGALGKLIDQLYPLWPKVAQEGEFDWTCLMDPENREGAERFDSQYWRANVDPSERYVMSLKGTSQYRLKTDETIFNNLYITGDWLSTGVNAGCVEAAVMAGMQTSRAICGVPAEINGENGFLPDD
ncbi:MAG: NAD(P)-binding protein [Cellvibrionaceae bacterium]